MKRKGSMFVVVVVVVVVVIAAMVHGIDVLETVDPETVSKNFTQALQARVQVDWQKQAPEWVKKHSEYTCWPHWGPRCLTSTFSLRQRLLKPEEADFDVEVETDIMVDYDAVAQKRVLNINSTPMPVHTEDSTWESEATTHGWNAGATLLPEKRIMITGGYSFSRLHSHLTIKSFGLSESCPGGFHCRFETWFYHVHYKGACRRSATISCDREYDVCPMATLSPDKITQSWTGRSGFRSNPNRDLQCPQFYKWAWHVCWDKDGPGFSVRQSSCSFRVPILEPDKRPLATLVFVKEDHRSQSSDYDDDEPFLATDMKDDTPTAIKAGTSCMFLLDTGEWYDLLLNLYNDRSGKWVQKPDAPTPFIPRHMRAKACRQDEHATAQSGSATIRDGTRLKVLEGRQVAPRSVEIKVVAGFRGFD